MYLGKYTILLFVLFVFSCNQYKPIRYEYENFLYLNWDSLINPIKYPVIVTRKLKKIEIKEIGLTINLNKIEKKTLTFNKKDSIDFVYNDLEKFMWQRGEFSYEFTEVINLIFPIDACNLLKYNYFDEGTRLYLFENKLSRIDSLSQKIKYYLPELLFVGTRNYKPHGISVSYSSRFSIDSLNYDNWKVKNISYDNWYGDYGARSNIKVFMREVNNVTVVFVFTNIGAYGITKRIKDFLVNISFE